MIGVNRRRVMGDPPYDKYGYIKKGKVLHFDGIDKGSDPSAWTDLVQGISCILNEHSVIEDDGVVFDGAGVISSKERFKNYDELRHDITTMEVVYVDLNPTHHWVVGGIDYQSAPMLCASNGVIGINHNTNSINYENFKVVSINATGAVCDGNIVSLVQKTTAYNSYSGGQISIGARNIHGSYYGFKGKILSLRIYNRLLSVNEMLSNQQIDNKRFNLGLNI